MNKIALNLTIIGLLAFGAVTADAAVVAKAVSKAAARRIDSGTVAKQLPKQKLGSLHTFKKPTTLVRATNRPATERFRGIGKRNGHVFTRYPRAGRTGSADHIQKELAIHHKVKAMQTLRVPAGTKYHVRPIKGGEKNRDEVIIHGRLPRRTIVQDRKLTHLKRQQMSE